MEQPYCPIHEYPARTRGLLRSLCRGSAGGLQAYVTLLQHLPVDLGIAVVIVNHMRSAATTLHKILPPYTTMPVELINERLVIEPNRVYIIPENRELHILEGTFRLRAISKTG
jgi:two-component system, chemotaxis family, protein-glutamate methylesterase/glutaminase